MRRIASTTPFRLVMGMTLIAGLLGFLGCSEEPSPTGPPVYSPLPPQLLDEDYEMVEGEIGGAYYALYRPAEWNGDLVIVAHGYYSTFDYPEPPGADEFFIASCRQGLLDLGYGVAYTSYPELGWCVKEGLNSLHQMRGLYTGHFGRPDEVYLAGLSMGGLMVVALAEEHPREYAGALAESGPLAGADAAFGQVFTVRALFDYYYPDVLPGTVVAVPPDIDVWGAINAAIEAMVTDPGPLTELAAVDQLDLRYNDFGELMTAVMWHLYFQLTSVNELVERIGGSPLDNATTWYSGTSDDEALNAGVVRFSSPPPTRHYLERYYEPDGRLRIPVLTLHNARDPLVPLGHEEAYATTVAQSGCSDLLRQRTVDRQDHVFTDTETIAAFQELVAWVQSLQSQ